MVRGGHLVLGAEGPRDRLVKLRTSLRVSPFRGKTEPWSSCECEPQDSFPLSGPTFDPQDVMCGQRLSRRGPHARRQSEDTSSVPAQSLDLDPSSPEMEAASELKVILRDTTRVTLNQRFSDMMKNKPLVPVTLRSTLQQQGHHLQQYHRQPQRYQQYWKQQQQQYHQQCQRQQLHYKYHHQQQYGQRYQHQQQSGGSCSASPGASTTSTSGSRHRKLAQQLGNFLSAQTPVTMKPEKRLGKSNIQAHLGWHATPVTRGSVAGGRDLPTSQSTMTCGDTRGGRGGQGGRATRVPLRGARASRELAAFRSKELPQGRRAVSPPLALRRGGSRGQESPGRVGSGTGALAHRLLVTHGPLARNILARGGIHIVVRVNSSSSSSVGIGNRGSRSQTRGRSLGSFDGGQSRRGRGSSLPPLTKKHLDNQLDAYMVARKGSLSDLDS